MDHGCPDYSRRPLYKDCFVVRRGFIRKTARRLTLHQDARAEIGPIGNALGGAAPAFMRVHDVDRARVEALAAKVQRVSPGTRIQAGESRIDDVDILPNATPIGMLDDARLPLEVDTLPARLVVLDAIVKSERTPLIQLAESRGCSAVYGREMMHGQVERMVDYFTGAAP